MQLPTGRGSQHLTLILFISNQGARHIHDYPSEAVGWQPSATRAEKWNMGVLYGARPSSIYLSKLGLQADTEVHTPLYIAH